MVVLWGTGACRLNYDLMSQGPFDEDSGLPASVAGGLSSGGYGAGGSSQAGAAGDVGIAGASGSGVAIDGGSSGGSGSIAAAGGAIDR